MDIKIRLEEEKDYFVVENLVRDSFWGVFREDCDEHLLVHKLRRDKSCVHELNFIAEVEGKIVGQIMFSKGQILSADSDFSDSSESSRLYDVLTFGPLSVLPEYKYKKIGMRLLNHAINEAKKLNYLGIIIFGHHDYYAKFGFKNAAEFNIQTSGGKNFDCFMALELHENAFSEISGKFLDNPIFEMSKDELSEFEKNFSEKAKKPLISIDIFKEKLPLEIFNIMKENKFTTLANFLYHSEKEFLNLGDIDAESLKIIKNTLENKGYVWGRS